MGRLLASSGSAGTEVAARGTSATSGEAGDFRRRRRVAANHAAGHLFLRLVGSGGDALHLQLEFVHVGRPPERLVVGDEVLPEQPSSDWSNVCIPYCDVPAAMAVWMRCVFSLSTMQSRMKGVVTRTSTAGQRPWPSARGRGAGR